MTDRIEATPFRFRDTKLIPKRKDHSALKAYAASNLDQPPAYNCDDKIKVSTIWPGRGERLSNALWIGRMWAVTVYGVERRDGLYSIHKDNLWDNEDRWGWVNQIGAKEWDDLPDFAEALRLARGYFRSAK